MWKGVRRDRLMFKDGMVKTLLGVMHIPWLARNLISLSKMSDVGVKVIFK